MKPNTISNKVLEAIEQRGVTPKPRWFFVLQHVLTWSVGLLFLFVGALATAIILAVLFSSDFDLLRAAGRPLLNSIIVSLPYVWIVLMVLFVVLAQWRISHTKKGYKYSPAVLTVIVFLLSIALGGVLHLLHVGASVHGALEHALPAYSRTFGPLLHASEPEEGILAGTIVFVSENELTLAAPNGDEWQVNTIGLSTNRTALMKGRFVRIIGQITAAGEFRADIVKVKPKGQFGSGSLIPPHGRDMVPGERKR